jgi:hypothetical protein
VRVVLPSRRRTLSAPVLLDEVFEDERVDSEGATMNSRSLTWETSVRIRSARSAPA